MEKFNVTIRFPAQDVEFLDELAQVADRDRTYLIRRAVADFIAQQKWQIEEVRLAQAEAQQGKVLSDEDFSKHVKSWPADEAGLD